ncbi:hypothetical protein GLAREA_08913 [Glarea lozoyensis ATCC 20868]|uniref:GPI anchored serine-rich protein n=2 Tax=Glarea lozoyensis TaxID=101852 RepID=S3DGD3_GLAL2|nr:uncharacterized protein GLAREA_08913 [Glarea lozoyensis ATCC 20868]EHK99261.1 hypothetical protein M7I_4948 [Glarea lozoyensis 74030]EPE36750.1 hypothetical protein GLAREA_08913 [Glarea lozoyensis ATCC 20868]
MQFSFAAVAFMASAVMAQSTVYSTKEVTITSCGPTVTNCPAASTVVSKTTYPVVYTSAPVVSASPINYTNATTPVVVKPVPTTPAGGNSGASVSVIAISSCVPTVIYSTITVQPSVASPAPAPSSTGYITPPKNVTSPAATATPTMYANSAAGLQASAAFAAVAGLVAAFLI